MKYPVKVGGLRYMAHKTVDGFRVENFLGDDQLENVIKRGDDPDWAEGLICDCQVHVNAETIEVEAIDLDEFVEVLNEISRKYENAGWELLLP